MFFALGIFTMLIVVGLLTFNKMYNFKWLAWLLSGLGIFLLVFAIGWSVSSVLEGEPRAASMGMVFFGIPSLLLLFLARRVVLKPKRKSVSD